MKVKRLYYFIELQDGTERKVSEAEFIRKCNEYEALSWDRDEFSRNFINTESYVQYENCISFYLSDSSITLGYGQREIH